MTSDRYLAFVRTLPCAACGTEGVDAHHITGTKAGGMGTKPPDCPYAIPLCRLCHTALHADPLAFEQREGISQQRVALRTVELALQQGALRYGD